MYNIHVSDGEWYGNEVSIMAKSEAMERLFYNEIGKLLRIRRMGYWKSLAEIDFDLGSQHTLLSSTTDILKKFQDLDSLSLVFTRLSMLIEGISRGDFKLSFDALELSSLTLDDLEFIQQCRPISLNLPNTEREGERRIAYILRNCPSIIRADVECDTQRFVPIIDLMKTTRESIIQSGGRPALLVFNLRNYDNEVKLSFGKGSSAFSVEARISLEDDKFSLIETGICDFVRKYGWSINVLFAERTFSDLIAQILDESTEERGSRIARLYISPPSLTGIGLNAMNRVIDRSQGLTYLRLQFKNLKQEHQLAKALLLLEQHKNRLTSLHFRIWTRNIWIKLREFYLTGLGCLYSKSSLWETFAT